MAYSTNAIAELLDWTPARVRRFVRNGLIEPTRTSSGFLFEFSDLVVLRTARQLEAQSIPPRKLLPALKLLRRQLPDGRALSTVRLAARGANLLVREGSITWEAGSGQIDLLPESPVSGTLKSLPQEQPASSNDLYNQAIDKEAHDTSGAMEAYAAVLEQDPEHFDARINLGRLAQEQGNYEQAKHHYETVLSQDPDNALALFNLGTVAQARGKTDHAIRYYQQAAEQLNDAHFNLACLYESQGNMQKAIRHLRQYQRNQKLWQQDDLDNDQPD